MNMKISTARGLVRALKAEGISWVSAFPVCGINNACGQEGMPIIMMREERYAVAVADAYSRVTGGSRIGACTVMGGVNPAGLEMAYGAVAQAYEDSSPLLVMADTVPAGAAGNTQYDVMSAFKGITKWIGHIDQPHRASEVMQRAFTFLRTGRRGPVLVTIPRGVSWEYDDEEFPYVPVKGWRSGPDPDDVKAAVRVLLAAKRPLLVAGEGVLYGQATEELRQLAELVQAPVMTTLKGKSAIPENHALAVGVRGELANHFLKECDLVFAIGASLFPSPFSQAIPDALHKTIVQCNHDELDINRAYRTSFAVIGDTGLTLPALVAEVAALTGGGRPANQEMLDEIVAYRTQLMAKYQPLLESNDRPINPYRVYGDLMKVLDRRQSFVTAESGNTRDQTTTIYQSLIPHGFMGWGNVTSLGFSLAAAVAAKLAYPKRQSVHITGDAGVGYMLGTMEALVRHNIGVTTIHINNGGFSGYGPGFWGAGHSPYTHAISDHSVADMSQAVKAIGYYAEDVSEPAEIIPALKRAFAETAHNRPAYLEFICSKYPVYGTWLTE
jgi:thiamine pyrophosphate-dependent acetolactate synthase large subunit-like protein